MRLSSERSFAFSLSHSTLDGGLIKSAKRRGSSSGSLTSSKSSLTSLIQGGHTTFVFAAEDDEDRMRWVRALRENCHMTTMLKKTMRAQSGGAAAAAAAAVGRHAAESESEK